MAKRVNTAKTAWLNDAEQQTWRALLRTTVMLLERLDADLQEDHGISLSDYEVLVNLSEEDEGRMRMGDLASRALVSRSRLSHAVDRLAAAGLVNRERCGRDRPGT